MYRLSHWSARFEWNATALPGHEWRKRVPEGHECPKGTSFLHECPGNAVAFHEIEHSSGITYLSSRIANE